MNYLPGMRDALVRAAEQKNRVAAPGGKGASLGARGSARGVMRYALPLAGSAAALLVVVVVVLSGGRSATIATAARPRVNPYATRARTAAERLLSEFQLPSAATSISPTHRLIGPLAAPADSLGTPDLVDVHRFWTVRDAPASIIKEIEAHPPLGSKLFFKGQLARGASVTPTKLIRSKERGTTYVWSTAFQLPADPPSLISRELSIEASAIKGGRALVRVDVEVVWLVPRKASERIPDGVASVEIKRISMIPMNHFRAKPAKIVTSPKRVLAVVRLLDSLPLDQPGYGGCVMDPGIRVRIVFRSIKLLPVATAVVDPACSTVNLAIGGKPQPELALSVFGLTSSGTALRTSRLLAGIP